MKTDQPAPHYEAPKVEVLGSFESLTQAQFSGNHGDWRAAQGQPMPILS